MIVQAQSNDAGRRIDRVLRKMMPRVPLSLLYRLLRTGAVRLNGVRTAPHARVAAGDRISLPSALKSQIASAGATAEPRPEASHREPPEFPAIIDNNQIFVISKPAGVAVAGPGSERPLPLSHHLEPMLADRTPKSLSFHPVPVHRLDRICSGLLIYAKTIDSARNLTAMLRERRATKVYLVLLERVVHRPEWLETRLRYDPTRRRAVIDPRSEPLSAHLRPISTVGSTTLAAVSTRTGRRHQVRAMCAQAGMPLAGDRRYGSTRSRRPFLHAWLLCSHDPSLLHAAGTTFIEAPPDSSRIARHSTDWKRTVASLRALYNS